MSWTVKKVFGGCECPILECVNQTICGTGCINGQNRSGLGIAYPCYPVCGSLCVGPTLITLPTQGQTYCPMVQPISYNPTNEYGIPIEPANLPCLLNPITGATTRDFIETASLNQATVTEFYNYYNGVFPINSYSSLPTGPNAPNGGLTSIYMAKLKVEYQSYTAKDRVIILSGFNRYNYIGPLAPGCTPGAKWGENAEFYLESIPPAGDSNVNYIFDVVGLSAVADRTASWYSGPGTIPWSGTNPTEFNMYGIRAIEKSIRGRYPLPDNLMDLPLFGELPATPPPDGGYVNPSECCEALQSASNPPCVQGCFGDCPINYTDGTYSQGLGHYFGTQEYPGGATYRYSAACFNPDSIFGDLSTVLASRPHIPHCSLYSLLWAIRNYVFQKAFESASGFIPSGIFLGWNGPNDDANGMSGSEGDTFWYDHDPGIGGYSGSDKLNAITVMQKIQEGLPTGTEFGMYWKIPKLLLWDKDSYINAATTKDKWKHVYVPGNLNILFDTGCVGTQGVKTKYFTMDNTCILAGDNFRNQPKVVGMMGCQPQDGSIYEMEIFWLDCGAELPTEHTFGGFTGGCGTLIGEIGIIAGA